MKTKWEIRYNHRSTETATSKAVALNIARWENGGKALSVVEVPDGIYCYRTKEDMRRDDTGARAFAVICPAE